MSIGSCRGVRGRYSPPRSPIKTRSLGTGPWRCAPRVPPRVEGFTMPRGDKSSYSGKQRRQAEHIEEGYEERCLTRRRDTKPNMFQAVRISSSGDVFEPRHVLTAIVARVSHRALLPRAWPLTQYPCRLRRPRPDKIGQDRNTYAKNGSLPIVVPEGPLGLCCHFGDGDPRRDTRSGRRVD
jgi:hypothetical protein